MSQDSDVCDHELLFNEVVGALNKSVEAFNNGEEIDIPNLERKVKSFCEAVNSVPLDRATEYKAKMEQIIRDIGNFIGTLQERRDIINEDISKCDTRSDAFSAYGSAANLNDEKE